MIVTMAELSFERISARRPDSPLLFICDHASNKLPNQYADLGLSPGLFETHIASDIGAAEVTRTLAGEFGATAIMARWSRLLIDLNRGPDDPTLVMKLSDGSIIGGNAHADTAEVQRRIALFYAPYHDAIAREISAMDSTGRVPIIVSVHSFTPIWKGRKRPWEVGILWDRDARLARPMIKQLERAGFKVGDNEPYSGEIEIRQDLIALTSAAQTLARRLIVVIESALAEMGPPAIQFTRPLAITGNAKMDERTREQLEAAVFRRLVAHLRARTDVQNIDLMTLAGFCRNCLGDWYREAAAAKGISIDKDSARELVYGMLPSEWKKRYQTEVTPEKQAAFDAASKGATGTHQHSREKTHS
jgi:predicted N-formylglutamate amidohydrolase